MSLPSTLPPALSLQVEWMMYLRRWGEKLVVVPMVLGFAYIAYSMRGVSLLDIKQDTLGYFLLYGALLLLWGMLFLGLLLAAQIFRTAYLAFGMPRALGYLALATVFAAIPAFFMSSLVRTIYGSLLVYLLWPGLFLVPSLIKEEIRRRYSSLEQNIAEFSDESNE